MSTYGFEPTVWEVEVVAGGLAFRRPRFRLAPGARDSLIVSLIDAEGRTVGPPGDVEFSVNRTEVATVDAAGVVTPSRSAGRGNRRTPGAPRPLGLL
jgi:hypothetical protein